MMSRMFKRSLAVTMALAIALSVATVLTAVSARPAGALPPLFQDTTVFSGRYEPTTIQFAPDGSVFVAEKGGRIWRYDSLTDTTASLVADMRVATFDYQDKGLLGLALDPNFGPARPYLWVQYAYDHMLGDPSPAPKWGPGDGTNDDCGDPDGNGCVTSGRVSKLTLSSPGGTVTNEQVLVEDWCAQFPSHTIGTIAFGADGLLYAGGGEGANYNSTDYGQYGGGGGIPANPCGDPPGGVGNALTVPSAQGGALRSQAARLGARESVSINGGKATLDGSIIRINPDTGLGVPGNPMFSTPGADANQQRIIAHGFRNPFRFSFKAGTNDIWLGDVGWNNWEEINTIPDIATSPTLKNYGWPCYEGNGTQGGYDSLNLTACENLYAAGAGAVQAPVKPYAHSARVVAGDPCSPGASAVSGVAYYNPPTGPGASPYPAKYNGALFFTDFERKCIWAMLPGAGGSPNPNNIELFADIEDPNDSNNPTGAVDLVESNTGDLYYVGIGTGEIHRIHYTAANHPPVASFTATPSFGAAPLNVAFDASASSDPDAGDTLTYAWDLDGNGLYNDATGVTASRTYGAGNVTVGLQVTDSHNATATTTRTISPGNTPPTATITAPSGALTWKVGDQIAFSGSATDAPSGALPASSLRWDVNLLTCDAAGNNCVIRQNQPFVGVSSGTANAPDWSGEGNTLLEFKLTATDASGLTDVKTVRLTPQKVTLTFQSNPTGLSLGYGSTAATTPFTETVIVNSTTSIAAPSPQSLGGSLYQFTSWSDGGAGSHNLTVPATATTYTATYTNIGPSNLVAAYGFEAGSGTSVLDSSGFGNTGTTANTTWSTAGKFGKALSFNGTNASVAVPDAASLDLTTGMTLEAWLNPTATGGWRDAFGKETTDDVVYSIYSSVPSASRPTSFIRTGGVFKQAAGPSALALNTWTHVATTYDGANLRFYVNGVLTATTPATGAIETSSGVLRIGGNSIFGEYFTGRIDEVRVYNTALNAAQITTDMNTAVAPVVTDTTPPGAPGTLSATGGLGGANLSWGAATDNVGVVRYDVYRSTTSGFTPSLANRVAQPTGLTYNNTGLAAGTYYYRVAAEDAAGNVGPPTNQASAVVTADITAPVVTLTAPAAGTVSGNVTFSATASDNVAVAGVQFKVDGTTNIGAEDTTAPYSVSWASTGVTNGTHTLSAVARDAAGNTTTVSVIVTVNNTGPAGPVAAYGFNAGAGTTIADSSGTGNNGTTANTTWSTAGKFGKALSFNGTNALVTVPDAASLDLTTGMTLEAWVNPNAAPAWGAAIAKETTGDQNYALFTTAGAGKPSGGIISGGTIFHADGTALALNTWTHIAVTYDGANLRFYKNGVLSATTARSGAIDVSSGVLHIGGNSSLDMFKGLIDEVRVYNRALTAAQITTDMNTAI